DGGTVNGYSDWTVTCVPGTRIRFTSASGDLQVTSPVSDLRATTASGEVTIAAADGDMRITMRVVEWLLHGRRHSYLLSQ
ncbi:MAG: hypothetical protein QF689_13625, partial [Candidatus Latescibacteria bacterium]|nr:hypothetical protein [Candidatus Latescibacterota bacterium]